MVFDLQHFFYESFAKRSPHSLSTEKLDAHFIDQICGLQSDRSFWAGMETGDGLHNYLVRYVLMYFDYDFAPSSFMEDYLRKFINNHRDYNVPPKTVGFTLEKASTVFGESQEVLRKMSPKEFARLYRLKAMELHPDKGGDHEKFVNLTNAYHALLKTKK